LSFAWRGAAGFSGVQSPLLTLRRTKAGPFDKVNASHSVVRDLSRAESTRRAAETFADAPARLAPRMALKATTMVVCRPLSFSGSARLLQLVMCGAITVFPEEVYRAPETWARRAYRNLIYFHEADKGGHFAAWEHPELFASELRAAFQSLR
jgi:pimeloyl-ACP methyl ester carboxylesterase